ARPARRSACRLSHSPGAQRMRPPASSAMRSICCAPMVTWRSWIARRIPPAWRAISRHARYGPRRRRADTSGGRRLLRRGACRARSALLRCAPTQHLSHGGAAMAEGDGSIALLAGASGLTGGFTLDALLGAPDVSRVIAVTRRPLGREHPRLANRIVQFERLESQLKGTVC